MLACRYLLDLGGGDRRRAGLRSARSSRAPRARSSGCEVDMAELERLRSGQRRVDWPRRRGSSFRPRTAAHAGPRSPSPLRRCSRSPSPSRSRARAARSSASSISRARPLYVSARPAAGRGAPARGRDRRSRQRTDQATLARCAGGAAAAREAASTLRRVGSRLGAPRPELNRAPLRAPDGCRLRDPAEVRR